MALSSSSTYAQITAQFDDSADYDLTGSVSKAKDFIHAARLLLRRLADEVEHGDERVKEDYRRIKALLDEATTWWKSRGDGGGTQFVHPDLAGFRT